MKGNTSKNMEKVLRISACFLGSLVSSLSHAAFGYCSYSAEDDYYLYTSYLAVPLFFALIWAFVKGPFKEFGEKNPGIAMLIIFGAPFFIISVFDDGACDQLTGNPY